MMSHVAVPNALPLWKRLLTLEPAITRGVIVALVSIGLIWGVDLTDVGDRVTRTLDIVGALLPVVTAWWIRGSVTPTARVVEVVQTDGTVVAGPASPLRDGTVVSPRTHVVHILPVDPPR